MNDDARRQLDQPQPLAVETTHGGIPHTVTRHGTARRVTALHDAWRTDEACWHGPIRRRSFAIELDGTGDLVIYQDLLTGDWYERQD
jgi:hypothetical protein